MFKPSQKVKKLPFILVAVALAIGGGAWYMQTRPKPPPGTEPVAVEKGDPVTAVCTIGGEKVDFLRDPEVVAIFSDRYNLTVNATKGSSMEMVGTANQAGVDCLWPSNGVASELFLNVGGRPVATEKIFSSPMVLYAWAPVADALVKGGIVAKNGPVYNADFTKLAGALRAGKTWKDLGYDEGYGKAKIYSSNPALSNSGFMLAAMLATVWNGGDAPDTAQLPAVLPDIRAFFQRMGTMDRSSQDLFQVFISQGVGSRPIIVSYENQLTELAITHPEWQQILSQQIRLIYPQPTVWSDHPLIALTKNGKRLLVALKDPDIQKIAWRNHGFRSGLLGAQVDQGVSRPIGVADQVTAVMEIPNAATMQVILQTLAQP